MSVDLHWQILQLPLPQPNRAGADTIGAYLGELLRRLWREKEKFDPKRPFSESGWSADLYYPLVQAGLVDGDIDPDNEWLNRVDTETANALIAAAVETLLAEGLPPATKGKRNT